MSWWDDIKQKALDTAAGWAKDHPDTAEWLVRKFQGDDIVDMVKFLHKEESGLEQRIVEAKKDSMFAQVYDAVYESTKQQIQSQVDDLPPQWRQAAQTAGIPVEELVARMKANGAEKIAFSIASSVTSEIPSMAWYSGQVAGDVFREARQTSWKEPEKGFLDDPVEWISTMVTNVINLVENLFSLKKEDLTKRGEQFVTYDTAEKAEEIVGKIGKKLTSEFGMPTSFAADTMVSVYTELKKKANPSFVMSDAEKTALQQQFLTQLQAESVTPQVAEPAPATEQPASAHPASQQNEPAATAQQPPASGPAAESNPPGTMAGRFWRGEGEYTPEHNYPDFASADLSKYRSEPGLLGHVYLGSLGLTLSLIASITEERKMEVIKSYLPDAAFSRDKSGNLIIEIGDDKFYWNRPGASVGDFAEIAMPAIQMAPVSKISQGFFAAKTFAGKALSYAGVGTALSVAEDSAASLVAGAPDVDIGNAVLEALPVALSGPLLARGAKSIGGIARKIVSGGIMSANERALLSNAGVSPQEITKALDPWLTRMHEKAAAASITAAAAGGTAAVITARQAAAGEPIPHEDADISQPVKPGKTPHFSPDDQSMPLMP